MIYLDYNATHPPIPEVLEKNVARLISNPANPSGISAFSQANQAWIEESRARLALLLGSWVKPGHLHFVSTGTESLYQLLSSFTSHGDTIITSALEHSAFFAACEDLGLTVEKIPVDPGGRASPDDLAAVCDRIAASGRKVACVSVMGMHNETGVLHPVSELARVSRDRGIPFVSDMIQAAGKVPLEIDELDGFVINGHKFGAGFGAAVVVIRGRRARPLFRGGLQEDERRAGTENLSAIGALPDALEKQLHSLSEKMERTAAFQKRIEDFLIGECGAKVAARESPRAPNTTFAVLPRAANMDFLLMGLDRSGIVVSTGSSCKSRTRRPSQTLLALGFSEAESLRALRISTGLYTNVNEIESFLNAFVQAHKAAA